MSFQFRRRGDVHEQSPQQEPFFQNTQQQQPFVDHSVYPQMVQPGQNYDPRFNNALGQMPQQPFMQNNPGNFYGQQQPQPLMNQPQGYGFGPTPQMHAPNQGQMPQQEAYLHPVQASQLNAQRANYLGNNFQAPGYPQHGIQNQGYQGFSSQGHAPQQNMSPQSFVPDEPQHNPGNQNTQNPMAFWNEPQSLSRFDDSENETANSPIKLLVAIAGVALIAAFSWFAYKWAKAPSSDTPQIIHAEPGPHKVVPDHRGGINIPYQDKLIYNRIGDSTTDDPAERLLPPPEQPAMMQNQAVDANPNMNMAQPQAPINNGQPLPQNGMQQQYLQQPQVVNPQHPVAPDQVQPPVQPQVMQPQAMQTPKAFENTEIDSEPTIKKTKSVESISGNYFVQLATVKSEAAALKEWKRLQTKHNLKGIKSQIKESERPDGEVFYRLLMGPFTEKVKALKYAVKIDGTKVVHVAD